MLKEAPKSLNTSRVPHDKLAWLKKFSKDEAAMGRYFFGSLQYGKKARVVVGVHNVGFRVVAATKVGNERTNLTVVDHLYDQEMYLTDAFCRASGITGLHSIYEVVGQGL